MVYDIKETFTIIMGERNMTYGYLRVSSKDQNEARQMISMQEAAIEKSRIYVDKQSGKNFNRPAYRKLMKKLKQGDVLFIKRTGSDVTIQRF